MELNEQSFQYTLEYERESIREFVNSRFAPVFSNINRALEIVSKIKEDLKQLHDQMAKNTAGLEFVRNELSFVREDVKRMVGRVEFDALESRVARLERSGRARS